MKLPIERARKAGQGTSYMSVQALQGMRDHAEELLNVITSDTSLPDWVEFKIARASQSLTSVFEYMNHGEGALKQAKTAKVDLRPAGRGKVRFYVLQAQGNALQASKIPALAGKFQMGVARALEMSGLFQHMLGNDFDDVRVESTRGGIAFSVRFDAQLIDPDSDVYDHLNALKKAFKSQGIAF